MSLSDETRTDVREFATDASERKVPHILVAPDVILALLDENDQLRAENAELEAHAEYMGRMLPDVRRNLDDWKAASEANQAAVDRVRALAAQIDREATAPNDYRGIRHAHANRIYAALKGAEQ